MKNLQKYFREIDLYNPKKQNNTCNGEYCSGLCAKFDATRKDVTASCPEYYILSWTEAEGKLPPETAVILLNPVVEQALSRSTRSNTPILTSVDTSGNTVFYIGIPTQST